MLCLHVVLLSCAHSTAVLLNRADRYRRGDPCKPRRGGERGEVRTDGALALPLDAMGTNLLAAEVGGRDGGFELRHDRFRDAIMREARRVGYSVRKEFSLGPLLSEANEVLLRGAAAVATADADAGVPDEQLDSEARQARQAAAQAVARAQAILGAITMVLLLARLAAL